MHPISTREKCLYFWKNRSGFARLFPEAFEPEVPWVLTKGKRMRHPRVKNVRMITEAGMEPAPAFTVIIPRT